MSSLIKGPLDGAAAVRELTVPASEEPCDCGFKGLGLGGFHSLAKGLKRLRNLIL